ncbi:MAG: DUF4157 domain-containing protein [Chloroflexota bacterium]
MHQLALSDSRLSHPANADRRAALVLQLQQRYGNSYVQRLVERVHKGRPAPVLQSQEEEPEEEAQGSEEVAQAIASAGSGQPLEPQARARMEEAFGHDFSGVQVHTDATADHLAEQLGARAFTTGRDIFFRQGEYRSHSPEGEHLLAHELTHVVQQAEGRVPGAPGEIQSADGQFEREADRAASDMSQRDEAEQAKRSYGQPGPVQLGALKASLGEGEMPSEGVIQRAPDDGGALAKPTLTVSPSGAVQRGDQVTLTINFTPTHWETLKITKWQSTSADGDTVNRPESDIDFQTKWQGPLVLSGQVAVEYSVEPLPDTIVLAKKGELKQDLQVTPRTGAPWASTVNLEGETSYGGQPSPPKRFRHLGNHNAQITGPAPKISSTIPSGPNKGFRYVESLTPGTYKSQPSIHPDLTNVGSQFYQFHLQGSRLYVVEGSKRTLVPTDQYSNLKVKDHKLTFTVPNWEEFYKRYGVLRVRATGGGKTITCQNDWWALASNAQDAAVVITDEDAVRNKLKIGPEDSYSWQSDQVKTYTGCELINSATLLRETRRHEYAGTVHSHRANFLAMVRALDPQLKLEELVSTPKHPVNFTQQLKQRLKEIMAPDHHIVDEAQSQAQEKFVPRDGPDEMYGVNYDEAGNFLGSAWNISDDREMTN